VPVIQVRIDEAEYQRPYDGFNAVLQTSLTNLAANIRNLVRDSEKKDFLVKNGHTFVKQYYNFPSHDHVRILKKILD